MAKYKDFDDEYEYDNKEQDGYYYDEQYYYEEEPDPYERVRKPANNRKGRKKKKGRKKFIAIFAVEFIVLLGLLGVWYFANKISKIHHDPIDRNQVIVNQFSQKTENVLKGYRNILLLGSDARESSIDALNKTGENHTDAILVASINLDTYEVRLVSIYRDTLMRIPKSDIVKNEQYNKATEAMFFYGAESTMSMLNTNLDLDIKDYILVNWEAVIQMVDAVGGIDIDIDEEERYWINEYMRDTALNTGRGSNYEQVQNAGHVHLNGLQATAYCRIRATSGWDYRRTERQRTVISKVVEKAKKFNLSQINKVLDAVCENMVTSMDNSELVSMAKEAAKYSLTQTGGFPYDRVDNVDHISGLALRDPVIAKDLVNNVAKLHQFLFDVNDFEASDTVKEIDREINNFDMVYR